MIILVLFLFILVVTQNKQRLLKISVVLLCILLTSVISLHLFMPKIDSASDVLSNPHAFKGIIGVVGEVTINDNGDMHFIIDKCKKRKLDLPLKYIGNKYMWGTEVIAYGKLEREEIGGYYLNTDQIISKNDDLKGSLIYFSKKFLERQMRWIYENFPVIVELKKGFIVKHNFDPILDNKSI